jgi:hypothetical protein
MAFKLPEFDNPYCRAVTACGRVKSKDKKVLGVLRGPFTKLMSGYKTGSEHAWLLTIFGGGEDKQHFHMEVMSDEWAKTEEPVRENRPIDEVQELLRPMNGRKIDATVSGAFLVPVAKLPEDSPVRPFTRTKGNITVKTKGMILEYAGSPVPRLVWTLMSDGVVRIDLEARVVGKIDEDYLDWCFDLLNTAFYAYVFGELPEEADA